MILVMSWLNDPAAAVTALPPLALVLFVFGSAMLEYLFPPYWGDAAVLLGFFLSGQGAVTPIAIFAAATAGSALGALAAYYLGRRYGMAVTRRVLPQHRRLPSRHRVQSLFQRFGEKLLLLNRFLPVVRGVMLYAAGALRFPLRNVLLYCTVSNLIFITMLMWVGLWTADSWPEIQRAFRQSNSWLAGIALVAAGLWLVSIWWRRSRFGISSTKP